MSVVKPVPDNYSPLDPAVRRRSLNEWLTTPSGQMFSQAETALVEAKLPDLFGYYLLQLGRLGNNDLLGTSRILNRLLIEVDGAPPSPDYPVGLGRVTALPIESDSIDVVLMPHILEFETEPHEALREACRVLVPEGHLIISGFNPVSLLGVSRLRRLRKGASLTARQFFTATRVKDWLAVLGFDVLSHDVCFFRPALRNEKLMRQLQFLETIGGTVCPFFGGAYVMVAKKRVTTLTIIRPRWRPKRKLVGVGLARPSTRGSARGAG